LQPPSQLPGFWLFMYRVSPFTYWIGGLVATMLAGRQVYCSDREISVFDPPSGQTCGAYLQEYVSAAGGTIQNPSATSSCEYCSLSNSNQFLASVSISYSDRWRNFGIIFAFILFNVFVAVLTYYLFRVANLKTLTAKFHKTKKGAKAKGKADQVKEGAAGVAAQGAHPGQRSGERDA
jgi:ATP-binding cassette subfamily G (WHITE) protein 2 (PDR)